MIIDFIEAHDFRKLSEWYAHPASAVWKQEIYPSARDKIICAFKKATTEEARGQMQGALCLLDELHEKFESARRTLDILDSKKNSKREEREV